LDATARATTTEKHKSSRATGTAFDFQRLFEFPKFMALEMPKAPMEFSALGEVGASYAKQSCDRLKALTAEATAALENSYASASKGASEYGLKVIEITRANTNSAFDFYTEMLSVKSLSDLIGLSTARARAQIDAAMAQSRQLGELAHKVTTDSFEPLKQSFTKAANKAS
jgi:phasin